MVVYYVIRLSVAESAKNRDCDDSGNTDDEKDSGEHPELVETSTAKEIWILTYNMFHL